MEFIQEVKSYVLLLFTADEQDSYQPPQCSPPILMHCSAEGNHLGNND